MNLRAFDLNLLVVFEALIETRSTRRAGARIGLSQPAVSNALARLRDRLDDELFVRGRDGMHPTPRALELSGPVRQALREIGHALDPPAFDPATARRSFWLGANDYTVTTVLPRLMVRLGREAPGIDLRIKPSAGRSLDLLDSGEIDLAMAVFLDLPERFESHLLRQETYLCAMRRDHPLAARKNLCLRDYAAANHLLVSPRGDETGFVDRALAERGMTRRVGLTINSFAATHAILAVTDMITTIPGRVARTLCAFSNLALVEAPIQPGSGYGVAAAVWHRRLGAHPASRWFREFVIETALAEEPQPSAFRGGPRPARTRNRRSAGAER